MPITTGLGLVVKNDMCLPADGTGKKSPTQDKKYKRVKPEDFSKVMKGAPMGNKNAAGPRNGSHGPSNRSDQGRAPLKDHPYHGKTDDELRYIVKDAGETARIQRGMSSESKYLDQMNDAATVLYHRKTQAAKPAPGKTADGKPRSFSAAEMTAYNSSKK